MEVDNMAGFFIAVISGILMSVQGVFNTQVTKETGVWVSNAWVQFSAFMVCAAAWLASGKDDIVALLHVAPRYTLLGGVIGAGITFTVIQSIDRLGTARGILLIVMAQLISAYLIEIMGLFGADKGELEIRKLAGLAIALIGVAIFQWK